MGAIATGATKFRKSARVEFDEMRWELRRTARQVVSIVALAFVLFALIAAVDAQEAEEAAPTPAPTPTPQPTPIPAREIPDRAAEIRTLLREVVASTDFASEIDAIARDFEREQDQLEVLTVETSRRLDAGGPASVIEEAQHAWVRSSNRIDEWLNTLKTHATTIAEAKEELGEERQVWELTRDSADEVELPEALLQQVEETLVAIGEAEEAARSNRDAVLILQSDVARQKAQIQEMLEVQKEEVARRRREVVSVDSPPLWKTFTTPGIHGAPSEQVAAMWTSSVESIEAYVAEQSNRLVRQVVFLALLTVGLFVLRRRAALWVQQDRSLQSTVAILNRPIAAAFIITTLFSELFHPEAPRAWLDLIGLILLLAVLRILPGMVPESLKPGAYLLALVFFLHKLTDLAPDGNLINRLALLALTLTGAASAQWFHKNIFEIKEQTRGGWLSAVVLFARISFLVFVIATVANLIGAVGFAVLTTEGMLDSIYAAVLFWVAAQLVQSVVRVFLLTATARRLAIVRLHAETVRRTLFRLIAVLAVIGWVVMTFQGFHLDDEAIDVAERILESDISIGDFSIVPADILVFVIVVWLTFKISQLLRFVLETDVMPKMDLPRGVPGAISRLSHYAIIVLGFMIAATAAGLDFSRVNLIVGALGVGIGFGLQNVVNNFVSGLILLFERPVRVGDKVQLAEIFGTVKNIGMRASVVRTFQGAEVIVPNANLISAEVINWTLSDDRRRMDLPIGVAYGTDPQTVLDLLLGVANEHPDVVDDPASEALFLGFGDSSLDFQLRAWTHADFVRVSSELRVEMHAAIRAAGIEIPFPQRDLHLRSVAHEAAEKLSGRSERESD
jgi:small-conductance mechanosensitive channel